jgi:prevent-host-death family protein
MAANLDTHEFKARLSEFLGRVAFGRERFIVMRRGKPVAAVVSIDDLKQLERIEAGKSSASEKPRQHPIMTAYGLWADRDDLDDLVAEIYANREKWITDTKIWD